MSVKSNIAVGLAAFATLMYILAWITPWWFFKFDGRRDKRTNCFIDGTCRNNGNSFKRNGNVQDLYDDTVILMAIAFPFFLIWLHYLLFQRSAHYGFLPFRKLITIISGLLAFLFILAAVITFGVGVHRRYGFGHDAYGTRHVLFPIPADAPGGNGVDLFKYHWGLNAGWYFAVFSLLPILIGTILAAMMGEKTRDQAVHHGTAKGVQQTTTTTTTSAVPGTYGAAPPTTYATSAVPGTTYTTTTEAVPGSYVTQGVPATYAATSHFPTSA